MKFLSRLTRHWRARAIRVKLQAMKTSSNLLVPTALLLLGGTAYGSVISANKLAADAGFPFIAYTFWQMLIAAALLVPLSVVLRCPPRLTRRQVPVYGVVTIFGLLSPTLVLTFLAGKLPPSVLILMVALVAVATYLLALAVRSESFRWLSLLGVALGFAGVLFVILPEHSLPEPGMALWVVFALLIPATSAINNVFAAKLLPADVNSLSLSAGLMGLATPPLLILMLLIDGPVMLDQAGMAGVWPTLWAAAGIAITYVCFFEILRRAGPLFFAQLNYVVVAAGVVWAYIIFGETPSNWLWGAIAIIALGLAAMNIAKARALRRADG
jgi:drug/metabolite transporter (DMT)-like permease